MTTNNQMRIAFVSDWFLPRLGGIELQLKDLALRLRARHCDVHVHTTTPGPAEIAGIPVTRVPALLAPGLGFAISPNLVATIRRELEAGCYTVLHVHMSIISPLGYAAIVAGRDLGLPTVVTFHSVLGHTSQVLRFADRFIGWSKWPLALTGVSELVASELRRAAPALKVEVLPNGVDPDFWRIPPKRQDAPILVVSAMRLARRKRPLALLRAFHQAQRLANRRQLKLCIAGMGSGFGAMQRYVAQHDLQDDVKLLGVQSREDLRDLFSRAHIFVLPSIQEAFGIAALEARCASLPVVAMRTAGCSDFLATHGASQLLANNDDELAAHIARLVSDDTRLIVFREANSAVGTPWAITTGLMYSRPGHPVFQKAIDIVLSNCKSHYYGINALCPTGPNAFGEALASTREKFGMVVGDTLDLTPTHHIKNRASVMPDGTIVAWHKAGRLLSLSEIGTNDYNFFWQNKTVYGEEPPVSPKPPGVLNSIFRRKPRRANT